MGTTTTQPVTTPADATCSDVSSGATITNSWTCRNCVQLHINFVLTADNLAVILAQNNFQLEIWFDNDVSPSTMHYPVVSTSQPASNAIRFTFASGHQWPNNLVQFDAQLRFSATS